MSAPPPDSATSLVELAQAWVKKASSAQLRLEAASLYQGRSFQDALAVAAAIAGELHVVSAGFGLVSSKSELPNYDLTIALGQGSISTWLKRMGASSSDWWKALSEAQGKPLSLATALSSPSLSRAFLALPASYLQLVEADLKAVPADLSARLAIFTSQAGVQFVPTSLQGCVLPYDDRLECLSGYAGTRTDFPQRAMRHFIEVAKGHELPLSEAKARVGELLRDLAPKTVKVGRRVTDEELISLLKSQWHSSEGSSTRLLRYLRDVANVSCEQKRFRNLWNSIKSERANASL